MGNHRRCRRARAMFRQRPAARTSATRLQQPAVSKRLTQFLQLTAVEHACKLLRADILARLVDEDGLRSIDVARATGLCQADLSEMYATAKTFPSDSRPGGVPYNILLLATRMLRKFSGAFGDVTGVRTRRDPTDGVQPASRCYPAFLTPRCRQRCVLCRCRSNRMTASSTLFITRFQDLLNRSAGRYTKIIHADLPYAYRNTAHGGYSSSSRTESKLRQRGW